MTTSDARWIRIESLFDEALECAEAERADWLTRQCGGDAELRREVERLLAAHGRVEGLLDRGPALAGSDLDERVAVALGGLYQIERQLGAGGSARVYLARERKHDRPVVIKVLRPEAAAAFGAGRFLREVHLAAQLAHPHILGLIDSGEADGLLYYVMPRVPGETLREVLDVGGPATTTLALTLLRDVAEALAYAHGQGVVHRDLKPDNVLVAGGHAYLMDFGIAMLVRDGSRRLTGEGIAIGTPDYMAPEQAAGTSDIDHRTDLHAWGRLASETLAGRKLSRRLATLIAECLRQNPAERPDSATDVLERLDAAVRAGRARWRRHAAAMTLGAVVVIMSVVLSQRGDTGPSARDVVAVAPFANETGDPAWDAWGRLAGDWITQGLQEAGVAAVVPWPTALQAWERAAAGSAPVDPVDAVGRGNGAALVVTGQLYLVGNRLRLQAEVVDAVEGVAVVAVGPIHVHRDSIESGLAQLRERVLGAVALQRDERFAGNPGLARYPPTLAAYREFDRGMQVFLDQRYAEAADIFHEAHAADTAFYGPLFYEAVARFNTGDIDAVDSVLAEISTRRSMLGSYQRDYLEYMTAVRAGDGERALAAISRAARAAPGSRAHYNAALTALSLNRPRVALAELRAADPDRGDLIGWRSYWTQLTHALHLLGEHRAELDAAREMRRRYPSRRVAIVLEARALASLRDLDELDSLLAATAHLPPSTYWSQAGAMIVAAEELQAHGRLEESIPYFNRAMRWLASHLARDPAHEAHRYWMGTALYDLGRWDAAAPYFGPLAEENPDNMGDRGRWAMLAAQAGDVNEAHRRLGDPLPMRRGTHVAWRARFAAADGNAEAARALMADALRYGVDDYPWFHAVAWRDFAPLLDDAPTLQRLLGYANSR